MMQTQLLQGDCLQLLKTASFKEHGIQPEVAVTFFDPPFNQGKKYRHFDDMLSPERYWEWVQQACRGIAEVTLPGGALYFMQREKNIEQVSCCLRETGWTLQNVIIWMKRTSAVPSPLRFGKQYQIIAFATKGPRPRVFHRLRIDAPLRPGQKVPRTDGVYVTDCWDDIRELTAGYFAGDEAMRLPNGERSHEQQSPVGLLARIILSSSNPGDLVLDPCAGTGTTLVAAQQLSRRSIGIEIDPTNASLIHTRLSHPRPADTLEKLREYYRYTAELDAIWPTR